MLKLLRRELWSAAPKSTASLGGLQSGGRPLSNEIALHLGQRRHDMKEEASTGRGCVDPVGDAGEMDTSSGQFTDKLDELAHGTTQAIELPNDEGVTWPEMRLGVIQPGPLSATSADLVREHSFATGALQRVDLKVEPLIAG